MKLLAFLFIIFLLGGTQAQRPQELKPIILLPVIQKKITDSLEREFINVAEESDRKTLMLIDEKRKADKENIFLRKENARLRKELNRIDTIYITKPNIFKRLFHKKKKARS